MKRLSIYTVCVLMAAAMVSCESEVGWNGDIEGVNQAELKQCPDGTVVSKDSPCRCTEGSVYCYNGKLYMCGDVIDDNSDLNVIAQCGTNVCNDTNTGCVLEDDENKVCGNDEKPFKPYCKDDKAFVCLDSGEEKNLDLWLYGGCYCSESCSYQHPCIDTGLMCSDNNVIMCDLPSGMRILVEECSNGCDNGRCKPQSVDSTQCQMKCNDSGNLDLQCEQGNNIKNIQECLFGCDNNECNSPPTTCEPKCKDGKLVCELNNIDIQIEDCDELGCDSSTNLCHTQSDEVNDDKLQKLLLDCNGSSNTIDNVHIALTEDVVLDISDIKQCNLLNSTIIGMSGTNNGNIKIRIKDGTNNESMPYALFNNVENSTIANITFEYDVNYEETNPDTPNDEDTGEDGPDTPNDEDTGEDGPDIPNDEDTGEDDANLEDNEESGKGMIAQNIIGSTISNIEINGRLNISSLENVSNIGGLAGVVSNTMIDNVTFTGNIELSDDEELINPIHVENIGGLVGICTGGCDFKSINVNGNGTDDDAELDNVLINIELTGGATNVEPTDAPVIKHIGGLVGYVQTIESENVKSEFELVNVNGLIQMDVPNHEVQALGGLFGEIKTDYSNEDDNSVKEKSSMLNLVSDCEFLSRINVTAKYARGIGGLAGCSDGVVFELVSVARDVNNAGINITTSSFNINEEDNGSSDGGEAISEIYSVYEVGGIIGESKRSILEIIKSVPYIKLHGSYFNRIGGVAGAVWLSTLNDIQSDTKNESNALNTSVEIYNPYPEISGTEPYPEISETEPYLYYIGGLVGKSYKSKYFKIKMSSIIKAPDENKFMGKYIGGVFGYMSDDKYQDEASTQINSDPLSSELASELLFLTSANGQNEASTQITNELDYIGGFAGYIENSTVQNVSFFATNIIGRNNVGGFVGYGEDITMNNVTNKVTKVEGNESVGGFIGYAKDSKINGVHNEDIDHNEETGCIIGKLNVGGFVGYGEDITMNNVTNKVTKVEGNESVGGFMGALKGSLKTSDNSKNKLSLINNNVLESVIGKNRFVGGFAGITYNGYQLKKIRNDVNEIKINEPIMEQGGYIAGFVSYITTQTDEDDNYLVKYNDITNIVKKVLIPKLNHGNGVNATSGFVGEIRTDGFGLTEASGKLNVDFSVIKSIAQIEVENEINENDPREAYGGLIGYIYNNKLDLEIDDVFSWSDVRCNNIKDETELISGMIGMIEEPNDDDKNILDKVLLDRIVSIGNVHYNGNMTSYSNLFGQKISDLFFRENGNKCGVNTDNYRCRYAKYFSFSNLFFMNKETSASPFYKSEEYYLKYMSSNKPIFADYDNLKSFMEANIINMHDGSDVESEEHHKKIEEYNEILINENENGNIWKARTICRTSFDQNNSEQCSGGEVPIYVPVVITYDDGYKTETPSNP